MSDHNYKITFNTGGYMNKITQQLYLDLVEISHNVINARQNDRLTRDINITITDNGQERELKETEFIYLRGRRTDGKPIFYPVDIINRKKGQIHVDIHNYVLSCPGRCRLDIGIYSRVQGETGKTVDEIASTEPFILYIPEEIFNEVDVVESDEGSTLSQLINDARDELDEMNSLEALVISNENERQFNETNRSNAESVRRGNENSRELMEKTRSSAEMFRNNAEQERNSAENIRVTNETKRQRDTTEAVRNANAAASQAETKANDLQEKLDSHHFVLTEDKDKAGGVPGLDENTKIPIRTLYANSSTNGGYVASGNGQADKVWKTDANGNPGWRDETAASYSLPLASDLARGGVKTGYTANGKNYPVQLSSEKMYVNVPWTDTNTTYPFYNKSIDGSFKTKFRTETKGNVSAGNYISNIRTDIANVESAPQFSAGIAWGSGDTNGYLNACYDSARVFIGGGNGDKLNWVKQLAFIDSNVASATNADTVDGKHASDFLSASGGTITGNLRLKGSSNFGNKLNFGDGDYVYLYEDTDDHLSIYAKNGLTISTVNNGVSVKNIDISIEATTRNLSVNGWIYTDLIPALVAPATSNKIGSPDRRWQEIWCSTSVNTSSDRNIKKNISALSSDDRYMKFFMLLQPKSYLFKDGESGRTHVGFISQDVEEAMTDSELTSLEFAGFCKDQKIERIENEEGIIEENPVFDDEGNPVYIYSLRYEEFIALNTMMIQKLHEENINLDRRLSILEEKISLL